MKKIINFLPDAIIFIGVWLLLKPEIFKYHHPQICLGGHPSCDYYNIDWDKIGIILILLGIDILVRRFLKRKK